MLIEILPCRAGTPREVAARCWDSTPCRFHYQCVGRGGRDETEVNYYVAVNLEPGCGKRLPTYPGARADYHASWATNLFPFRMVSWSSEFGCEGTVGCAVRCDPAPA